MGSFKKLSDPNWENVLPKKDDGYIPFKHTMQYLSSLAKEKQLMRKKIQKQCGIWSNKKFDQLFSTFDKLPGQIPIKFLEAVGYQVSELKEAYAKDLNEWEREVAKITKFSVEYLFTQHTFYMLHNSFPDQLKTIDEKLEYLIKKAKEANEGIYHCCVDLYPLLQIYFRPGGEIIMTGRRPQIRTDEVVMDFSEGSQDIILPKFLKESKIISESRMQNYYVSFELSVDRRPFPIIHVSGDNIRKL